MGDDVAAAFDGIDPADVPESVDRAALERMRTVAMVLDESIEIPVIEYRIGVDPLLSMLPGVGDALSAGISLYIVIESARLGVSFTTLLGMLGRISVDAVGGSIPVVGPVFDAVFKANTWNVEAAVDDLFPEKSGDDDDRTVVEIPVE
ncbi:MULTISPECIES: DUF4112 domain-containing protein [Halolamina]|uniref:DUF4112 domain-containing protein n=1 Tax=Halolamina pelagica TaxID=699431 RepID=A0A1I5NRN5_9EURY|nr:MULTISPECIES: DUF4112 domain-containing protein [Halolamina]NHX36424.1 DUF4112 domain-containing protein [Halolamina sp. R1-12]SFP23891.1 protein of unknown function [Halolamina pelagica]